RHEELEHRDRRENQEMFDRQRHADDDQSHANRHLQPRRRAVNRTVDFTVIFQKMRMHHAFACSACPVLTEGGTSVRARNSPSPNATTVPTTPASAVATDAEEIPGR